MKMPRSDDFRKGASSIYKNMPVNYGYNGLKAL